MPRLLLRIDVRGIGNIPILPSLCLARRPAGFLISHANCPDVPRNREEISVIISRTEAASSLPRSVQSRV